MRWIRLVRLHAVLVAAALALMMLGATAAQKQIACTADLGRGLGPALFTIQFKPDGRFDARFNERLTHAHGVVQDEAIRPDFNLDADPASGYFDEANLAERELAILNEAHKEPVRAQLPFTPSKVRRMKIYDLDGHPTKFGGTILVEAFDANGALLGRVFVLIPIIAICK